MHLSPMTARFTSKKRLMRMKAVPGSPTMASAGHLRRRACVSTPRGTARQPRSSTGSSSIPGVSRGIEEGGDAAASPSAFGSVRTKT